MTISRAATPTRRIPVALFLSLLLASAGVVAATESETEQKGKEAEKSKVAAPSSPVPAKAAEAPKKSVSPYVAASRAAQGPAPGAPRVITNDDLDKLYGAPEPAAQPTDPSLASRSGPALKDTATWLAEERERATQQRQTRSESLQSLEAAETRVADLQKRLRALRNPLLARPEAPEDDDGSWQAQPNPERVRRTEQELVEARKELREARRRFAEKP
jgi:hypothetical protein